MPIQIIVTAISAAVQTTRPTVSSKEGETLAIRVAGAQTSTYWGSQDLTQSAFVWFV